MIWDDLKTLVLAFKGFYSSHPGLLCDDRSYFLISFQLTFVNVNFFAVSKYFRHTLFHLLFKKVRLVMYILSHFSVE